LWRDEAAARIEAAAGRGYAVASPAFRRNMSQSCQRRLNSIFGMNPWLGVVDSSWFSKKSHLQILVAFHGTIGCLAKR